MLGQLKFVDCEDAWQCMKACSRQTGARRQHKIGHRAAHQADDTRRPSPANTWRAVQYCGISRLIADQRHSSISYGGEDEIALRAVVSRATIIIQQFRDHVTIN